ncbi:MAG: flagellar protein FliS [Firmicutes bacterium]|nr:flagellar protein FliS [Bacillota bacterium]
MSAANNNAAANAYKKQQVMTASPEELTLMLYNGAIRFINESIQAAEKKDIETAHAKNMRAQKIMREFMLTTDMTQEISRKWLQVDEYILHCLVQGNVKKDKAKLEEAKGLLTGLRDAWYQAMKQVRESKKAVGE